MIDRAGVLGERDQLQSAVADRISIDVELAAELRRGVLNHIQKEVRSRARYRAGALRNQVDRDVRVGADGRDVRLARRRCRDEIEAIHRRCGGSVEAEQIGAGEGQINAIVGVGGDCRVGVAVQRQDVAVEVLGRRRRPGEAFAIVQDVVELGVEIAGGQGLG